MIRCELSSLVMLFIFTNAFSSKAFSQIDVRYSIDPQINEMFVAVKVVVEGIDPNAILEVDISEQFGSANDYYRDVNDLRIIYPQGITFINSAPNKWRISSKTENGRLEYEYRIKVHQNFPNEKIRFKPSLNSKSYYSTGYPLFIFPARYANGDQELKISRFKLDFKVPEDWSNVTSLELNSGAWTTNKIDALLASTIALGNYRYSSYTLPNGAPFKMVLNGSWSFTDEDLAKAAYKIISAQINMMQSWHFPRYTVVLSQSTERGASGSGLENAFEMFGDSIRTLDDFSYLISHENFHYWNGNRIRYGAPRNRWFSEGFTEYYTYLMIGREKLGPLQTTLDAMSKIIQAYFENPVAEKITFAEAGEHFWEWLPEYGHLFYSKGMLIALMADIHLRSSSDNKLSLDGFMRFLDRKYFGSEQPVDDDLISKELKNYSGIDWSNFFTRFIFDAKALPINEYLKFGAMEITDKDCKRADLGFTMMPYFCSNKKPCGYQAKNVTVNGPAFRSGIREVSAARRLP